MVCKGECGICRLCMTPTPSDFIMRRPELAKTKTFTELANAVETLGTILTDRDIDAGRDAIHVAVLPVVAGETLYPGMHVGINDLQSDNGPQAFATIVSIKKVGIVDPFITGPIYPGQIFWMLLYPRTITSLRHLWTHPDFPNLEELKKTEAVIDKAVESEKWLRDFVARNDVPGYDLVMAAATGKDPDVDVNYGVTYDHDGDYITFYGRDAHCEIPPEFWEHVENVTGEKVPNFRRATYFSCSC